MDRLHLRGKCQKGQEICRKCTFRESVHLGKVSFMSIFRLFLSRCSHDPMGLKRVISRGATMTYEASTHLSLISWIFSYPDLMPGPMFYRLTQKQKKKTIDDTKYLFHAGNRSRNLLGPYLGRMTPSGALNAGSSMSWMGTGGNSTNGFSAMTIMLWRWCTQSDR